MLVGLTAVTNLIYGLWLARVLPEESLGPNGDRFGDGDDSDITHAVSQALMLLDLVTLTSMLYFSGGAENPFSFFYFVNLAVGGVMIRPRYAWSLTLLAVLGYTFLLFCRQPVTGLRPSQQWQQLFGDRRTGRGHLGQRATDPQRQRQ